MIVRHLADRIQLITQPDHAALSGRIMANCVPLRRSPRFDSILLAIREHDNGWQEEDASPAVDLETGRVVDFVTAPLAVRHRVWPRAIGRLSYDPWAAALVAQHALTVYDRYRSDSAWASFFADLEVLRDDMASRSRASLDDLATDYPFVRLGDLISLTFCAGWTEPQRFGEWIVQAAGADVAVEPSPFSDPIEFAVTARELSATPFGSDVEFAAAFLAAPSITLRGRVSTEPATGRQL
jgi:hypothetical protein